MMIAIPSLHHDPRGKNNLYKIVGVKLFIDELAELVATGILTSCDRNMERKC